MKSLLRPSTRAKIYTCDTGQVDQLAGTDKLGPGVPDLSFAYGSEFEVGCPSVTAIFRPFCFPYIFTYYSEASSLAYRVENC